MIWRDEWAAISGRIDGLVAAGSVLISALGINNADAYDLKDKYLGVESREILANLRSFLLRQKENVPEIAALAIERFIDSHSDKFAEGGVKGLEGLKLRLVAFAALRSSVAFHLADFEQVAHKRVERAFLHLQRLIVADPDVQRKWSEAFSSGEINCEKLGGAHLLAHGIWAFKINAEGGRTDLVLGKPLMEEVQISRTADSMIATEWKIVGRTDSLEKVSQAARNQLRLYSTGVLGGLELSRFRYVVLLSEVSLPEIRDLKEGVTTYRHICIAVHPDNPSVAARKRATVS